jgi:dolichol-phosphate mannosyltransferase
MPRKTETVAWIIPTLNEAENIGIALDRAVAALSASSCAWEIIVVDDSSSDGTADRVNEYSSSQPRVRLLIRRGHSGLAGAITYGWASSKADLLGVMDADLQHPPELIPALISEISNGSDITIASRYVRPHSMDEWNPLRRFISQLSVLASRPVLRAIQHVTDPLSGFFVVRRECIEGLSFEPSGFKLLLEILAKGRIETVSEIPFTFGVRRSGRSKAGLMTAVHYVWLLLKLSHNSVKGDRPGKRKTLP